MELYSQQTGPFRRRGIAEAQRREEQQEQVAKPPPAVVIAKGACPHCLLHIGRGIAFHIKRCATKEKDNG